MSPFNATIESFKFFWSAFFNIALNCWDFMPLVIDLLMQMSIAGMILTMRKKKRWFFYEWKQTYLYINKCFANKHVPLYCS
jgi:hypothetical protein